MADNSSVKEWLERFIRHGGRDSAKSKKEDGVVFSANSSQTNVLHPSKQAAPSTTAIPAIQRLTIDASASLSAAVPSTTSDTALLEFAASIVTKALIKATRPKTNVEEKFALEDKFQRLAWPKLRANSVGLPLFFRHLAMSAAEKEGKEVAAKAKSGDVESLAKLKLDPGEILEADSQLEGRLKAAVTEWQKEFEKKCFKDFTEQWKNKVNMPLSSVWTYDYNDDFARGYLTPGNKSELSSTSSELCATCGHLSHHALLSIRLSTLSQSSETCELCRILLECFRNAGTSNQEEVEITRHGSTLRMNCESQPSLALRVLSEVEAVSPDAPMGYPILLDGESSSRFELFRQWCQTCEDQHRCSPGPVRLPTRVLDVGDCGNRNAVRLHCARSGETGKYIALSHRWSTRAELMCCTHLCNIHTRQTGIDFGSLSKKFQEAVIVTQELGIRYLWIDSICIVQPHNYCSDDCPDGCQRDADWNVERDKMEEYFGSAYCTFAATAADNTFADEGFLKRLTPVKWEMAKSLVTAQPIHDTIDDFHRDVEEAELNKRGWVLQERALSRRIIHFTSTQAYFECGGGAIRCETLTKMSSETTQVLSDHEFPNFAVHQVERHAIPLYETVFTQYSKCGLTRPTDRPVAISGIESRLGRVFNAKWLFGIFLRYAHRCLLWRCPPSKKVELLKSNRFQIPSWSWMAYKGEITYMKVPFERVEWNFSVQFSTNEANVSKPCYLQAPARQLQWDNIRTDWDRLLDDPDDNHGMQRRGLIFDQDDRKDGEDIQSLRYIVLGKEVCEPEWFDIQEEDFIGFMNNSVTYTHEAETGRVAPEAGESNGREHYVLIVAPFLNVLGVYERVGVGFLFETDLSSEVEEVFVI